MIIAADIRGALEYQVFIYEIFKRITAQHPEHSFIFISDNTFKASFNSSQNVTSIIISKPKLPFLSDYKIVSLLKKYKADVFVTGKCLRQLQISQCLIALDTSKLKNITKANVIITDSQISKTEIIEKYKIGENKIDTVFKGVEQNTHLISFEAKEKIKEQYAAGNEYFLVSASTAFDNLLNVFKAFSIFKKMQKSNMQLLIVSQKESAKKLSELLQLYKFKNEVKVLENIHEEELFRISSAAYSIINLELNGYSILNNLMFNVPVITNDNEYVHEICGDAALYVDLKNQKDLSDKMMQIYKDEKLRHQIIKNGREQLKKYSWDNSTEQLWKSIEKACNN